MCIETKYNKLRENHLIQIAGKLELYICGLLKDMPRVDRVTARAKAVVSFVNKATKVSDGGKPKYEAPFDQIQDQIGVRVVVFYLSDVQHTEERLLEYFHRYESKDLQPEGDSEFGYVGRHHILDLPADVLTDDNCNEQLPKFFELQIKTLFQHSWAEANHDLGYKSDCPLDPLQKRKLVFTAAQAWGADQIFNELAQESQKAGR